MAKAKKNTRWQENHNRILDVYWAYYEENGKAPTQKYISETLDLTKDTICAHFKDMDLYDGIEHHRKFRDDILNQLKKNGDASSLKLWMQLVYQWSEKKTVEKIDKRETLEINVIQKNETDS